MRRIARFGRVVVGVCSVVLILGTPAGESSPVVELELLPDLDQRAPSDLDVRVVVGRDGLPRFRLGFTSAVDNVGQGPLILRGSRASTAEPVIVANQGVLLTNRRERKYADVGAFRFTRTRTHEHWHFRPFQRYELRRAADFSLVVRDRKMGFCLADRHESKPGAEMPGKPPAPVFVGSCGLNKPNLLRIDEGASVGYVDIYPGNREGQFLEITGLPAGLYVLVHRVNEERRLHESDYENNDAALLIELGWPRGLRQPPSLRVVAVCERGADCA